MSFRGFHSGENYVYKPSRYLNKPSRALDDVHGCENDVLKLFPHLNWLTRASETSTVVKTTFTNLHST